MCIATPPPGARAAGVVPVTIYGDGNPMNGIEDSREQIMRGDWNGHTDRSMGAGSIYCDGKIRGTAMIVDTREFAPLLKGVVLLSAAHVLYDLDRKRLFRRCKFHFMGWVGKSAYRAKIDLENVRMGDFSPQRSTAAPGFGEGDWAFLYLRKPWKRFNPEQSLRLRDFSFTQLESYRRSGGEFRLLAFDSSTGVISASRDCTVVESEGDDLGGGRWKGQLLDDCDSGDGASGGGITAVLKDQHYLIGIRSGSHWRKETFPVDSYPFGPAHGSVWDRHSNTNFGRAIDIGLLSELDLFIQSLGE